MYEILTAAKRAELLKRGLTNLVALLEPNKDNRDRPLVNATLEELEIAITMCGDAASLDRENAGHWKGCESYYDSRWMHLRRGGVLGATTDEEVAAEMKRFETWLLSNEPLGETARTEPRNAEDQAREKVLTVVTNLLAGETTTERIGDQVFIWYISGGNRIKVELAVVAFEIEAPKVPGV